jgi:hypothetical protein
MPTDATPGRSKDPAAIVLGYLNFSSGAFDPAAWRACSDLYAALEPETAGVVTEAPDAADSLAAMLGTRLRELEPAEPAFREATQARWALGVVFDHVLPGYRRFHADLLEHQPPGAIERPYFVMAAAQAVLAAASPAEDPQAAAAAAIDRLNDYVGWRPVAVLENGRLSEPYRHERVRPVPLYASGAGAAHGRYGSLVAGATSSIPRPAGPTTCSACGIRPGSTGRATTGGWSCSRRRSTASFPGRKPPATTGPRNATRNSAGSPRRCSRA